MHECPECYQACSCGGDIDDCMFDGPAADQCTHCDGRDEDGDWLWEEDEYDDFGDAGLSPPSTGATP